MAMEFDTLIVGGTVVDGTGRPRYPADIGLRDGRIDRIGCLTASTARERIDATGMIVAPGFIDSHTHDDTALLNTPCMIEKVSQGVTTVVAGNCGISIAPAALPGAPPPPLDLIGDAAAYRFPSMGDYLDRLDRIPAATNSVMLVGHSSLRASLMSNLNRAAGESELAEMKALLAVAMEQGAVGLSTGLAYQPARGAPQSEIVELAKVVQAHRGLYATHMRDEADDVLPSIQEAVETSRAADIPIVISHHKILGKCNHGLSSTSLAAISHAAKTQKLAIDVYPYIASSTVLKRDRVAQSNKVMITWSESMPDARGRFLSDIAADLACSEDDAIDRLQPAGAIYFVLSEEDVRRILQWPDAMIGSDGLPQDEFPHPRLWGSFPRMLGHYARDVGLFSLEEAVRKMTSLPARIFGLVDRGRINEGSWADIVIFDAANVRDVATFTDPMQPSEGIGMVLVNGDCVWNGTAVTGSTPGRALRRQNLSIPFE